MWIVFALVACSPATGLWAGEWGSQCPEVGSTCAGEIFLELGADGSGWLEVEGDCSDGNSHAAESTVRVTPGGPAHLGQVALEYTSCTMWGADGEPEDCSGDKSWWALRDDTLRHECTSSWAELRLE